MFMRDFIASLINHPNLTVKRMCLFFILLLQVVLLFAYLSYQKDHVEKNAALLLKNTALLEIEQLESSFAAMVYQVRLIGNAFLLYNTVPSENVERYLTEETSKLWLNGVIIFNKEGDFIASKSSFPLKDALSPESFYQKSFKKNPTYMHFRYEGISERLFYWKSEGSDPHLNGFAVYSAIHDAQGQFIGGALGVFSSRTLAKLYQKKKEEGFNLGLGGMLTILDHKNAAQLARVGAGTSYEKNINDVRFTQVLKYTGDVAQAHYYKSPVDSVERLGVFLNLNERKWILGVGLSKSEILHGWYIQLFWSVLGMFIIGILQWCLLNYIHTNALQRARLKIEAHYDPLTGLANRWQFYDWVQKLSYEHKQKNHPICVITIDIDHFKKINDDYGHDGGDEVLRHVGYFLKETLRTSDLSVRFGGEEFVVVMPCTRLVNAFDVAERIRNGFSQMCIRHCDKHIHFTASMGLTEMTEDEMKATNGIQTTLARADQALYLSKRGGRNKVTIA